MVCVARYLTYKEDKFMGLSPRVHFFDKYGVGFRPFVPRAIRRFTGLQKVRQT